MCSRGCVEMTEFFTRETWRAGKRSPMRKRVKPWGGRKTAPAAFLEAAKRTQFKPGRVNHRICAAIKRDGTPCKMLAFKGIKVCGAHGGFRSWAKSGKLQPSGRSAAARAAAVEGKAPIAAHELTRMLVYRQANDWTRKRMARAWMTEAWLPLMRQIVAINVCV